MEFYVQCVERKKVWRRGWVKKLNNMPRSEETLSKVTSLLSVCRKHPAKNAFAECLQNTLKKAFTAGDNG